MGDTPSSWSPPRAHPGASHTRVSRSGSWGLTRTRRAAGRPSQQVSGPPQGPPSSRGGRCICLSVSPQPTGFQGLPRPLPCARLALTAPQGPRCTRKPSTQHPRCRCALPAPPPRRAGVGLAPPEPVAGPARNPPQGPVTATHVEEVGGAAAGVHDTGHLHTLATALPAPCLVLEALGGGQDVWPEPGLGAAWGWE